MSAPRSTPEARAGAAAAGDLAGVRPAGPQDVAELVRLCAAHACYERAGIRTEGLADRLRRALFEPSSRLQAWVLERRGGGLAGYVTAAREFSTWRGAEHLHLDCLYLDPDARGGGHGRRLMGQVVAAARAAGVEDNLDQPLTIGSLAREGGASSSHLRHWFKVATGETLHRYVMRRRVERARSLLMQGRMRLSEVALASGFSDPSHMARWMRRELDMTPRELLRPRTTA